MYPETRKMMEMCCRMHNSRAFFWWPGVFGSALPRRCCCVPFVGSFGWLLFFVLKFRTE